MKVRVNVFDNILLGFFTIAFVDNDFVEGVLLLPDNLFYNTSAPGIVLFINKHKAANRKGKIILINASKEFEKGKESSKNYITQEGIQKIVKAFKAFEDIEKFAKIVTNEEVIKNDYNLSPSRYVQNGADIELQDIPTLLSEIKALEQEEKGIDKKLEDIFKKLNL